MKLATVLWGAAFLPQAANLSRINFKSHASDFRKPIDESFFSVRRQSSYYFECTCVVYLGESSRNRQNSSDLKLSSAEVRKTNNSHSLARFNQVPLLSQELVVLAHLTTITLYLMRITLHFYSFNMMYLNRGGDDF